ncbi:DMT family transporter [Rhizobium paknamense]|uniref:Drug/metabolite transporter (DMT)-like permease n=1 Tax=Rhizobium paknamense TaxID=1206817 RepID=A0ABU0IC78_9HYPH|nr:DMT family transporter [Rhizobium paknamense]MDQ0455852.1 drug/metabolite transporter (DMT)-like permease [Rhizobium paknamense]
MTSSATAIPASSSRPAGEVTNKAKAALLMMMAVSLFACLDSSAKIAARELPAFEVVWFRFALHFLLVAAIFNPWRSPEVWRTASPGLQMARASIQIVCTLLNFIALTYLQIAQTLSIQFMGPIFVTLLSVFFLGEKVGRYRWSAIFVGFAGVLVITRPTPGSFDPAFLIILASVLIGASYSILTRRLARTDSPGSMLLIMAAFPALILTPLMPFLWVTPSTGRAWAALAGAGVFGAVSHYFYIQAHRFAPASFLAPLTYFQFLAVLLLGYLLFGDVPTLWTFAGAAILIGSGLFIWYRERQLSRQQMTSAPA